MNLFNIASISAKDLSDEVMSLPTPNREIQNRKNKVMIKKKRSTVTTLTGFLRWVSLFDDGEYLFRGVSRDSYKIEASACHRLSDEEMNNPISLFRINRDLIDKARLLGHYQQYGQRLPDLDLLAELQHFGAATCLIDFSRNAQIALWFACQQSSTKNQQNGKVFAVRSDNTPRFIPVTSQMVVDNKIDFFFRKDEHGRRPLYKWQPKYQNNRIIAQQSVFIFGGDNVEAVTDCIVLRRYKDDILTSLKNVSGITEESIFPDADGFARQNAWNKDYSAPEPHDLIQHGTIAIEEEHMAGAPPSTVKAPSPKTRTPETTSTEDVRPSQGYTK